MTYAEKRDMNYLKAQLQAANEEIEHYKKTIDWNSKQSAEYINKLEVDNAELKKMKEEYKACNNDLYERYQRTTKQTAKRCWEIAQQCEADVFLDISNEIKREFKLCGY